MLVNRLLLAVAVAIAGTSAQSLNFTTCGRRCLNTTIIDGPCHSLTNVSCICTNTTLQIALGTCLQNCSASDLTEGKLLQNSTCSNVTGNGTETNSSSSATSSSPSSAASSTATTATKSNSASPVEQLPFISAIIAITGAAIGGAFAL